MKASRHSTPSPRIFHSIKWKLLAWQTVLLAGVLTVLLTLHYQFQKRDMIAGVDAELQDTLQALLPVLAPPHPLRRPSSVPEQKAAALLEEIDRRNVYIVSVTPRRTERYGPVPPSLLRQIPTPAQTPVCVTRNGFRERIYSNHDLLIVIGRPLDEVNEKAAALLHRLILVGTAILALGTAGGRLIVSRSLRPIRTISRTAETIAAGEHHRRIELADAPDELASLAQTLNSTFDHLDEAVETQKRFTADASHELRTPVAVIIAQTEAALKKERSAEEYKRVLAACLRAGKRMKKLADGLLELTRFDGRNAGLAKTRCDLNDLLSDAVDSASLLSARHPVHFQPLETDTTDLPVEIDRERIHQVVLNLIANAVQHNPDGCSIHVTLARNGTIEIADDGVGIPPDALPHIFDRFYRVETSRSRDCGGAGLGLSIVKQIVQAHGGEITAASRPGGGALFTITLPPAGAV